MKSMKIKWGPVLVPLAILLAVLLVYTGLNYVTGDRPNTVSLGQQYLNDLKYSDAILVFSSILDEDPTNIDARVGLAQAYAGLGDYDAAEEWLTDLVYCDHPNEQAAAAMTEILLETDRPEEALEVVETLIETTDKEEYYDLRNTILPLIYTAEHIYAEGTDQLLLLKDGQVLSAGSNSVGQLGTLDALGESDASAALASAGFPGQAAKVFCVGRNSFVIDAEGTLWAAGENRWGQLGTGYTDTAAQSGWTELETPGSVTAVAGTTGRVVVLLEDGTVWSAGSGTGQTWQRLTLFGTVLDICSTNEYITVLTSENKLYLSYADTPSSWRLIASDVQSVSCASDGLAWLTKDNEVGSSSLSITYVSWWQDADGNSMSDRTYRRIAANSAHTLVTDSEGNLYALDGDVLTALDSYPAVSRLYCAGDLIVVEFSDGSAGLMSKESEEIVMLDAAESTCVLFGHDFQGASCLSPGVCTVCGEMDTELGEHQMVAPTYTSDGYCSVCGAAGDPMLVPYNESTMLDMLLEVAGTNVTDWAYYDYNGDGTGEAFAIVSDDAGTASMLWYLSVSGAQTIGELDSAGSVTIFETDGRYFFLWTAEPDDGGTGTISRLFGVRGEDTETAEPYELDASGQYLYFDTETGCLTGQVEVLLEGEALTQEFSYVWNGETLQFEEPAVEEIVPDSGEEGIEEDTAADQTTP